MSQPIEAIDPDVKPANVVDNVNDVTPNPNIPDPAPEVHEPPRPEKEGMSEAGDIIAKMGERIESLEGLVGELVTKITEGSDENASGKDRGERLPWTHKGGRR